MSLFCSMTGFRPGSGQYFSEAWITLGSCAGTLAPTPSPTYVTLDNLGSCPDVYAPSTVYEAGDKVVLVVSSNQSVRKIVYECNTWPYSGYCILAAYAPGTEYGALGWTAKGVCT